MAELFTFARFVPGAEIGRVTTSFGADFLALWTRIYRADAPADDYLPAGAATIATMHAWRTVVDPKPPGNVHVGQRIELHAPARVGETIDTTVRCAAADERKGRRFVTLATRSRGDGGRALFSGETTVIWAR